MPLVAVGDDVGGAVVEVEVVQGDERVADEMRVRALDGPQAVVLVQELARLPRQDVEQRRHVDLGVLAEHAFDQRPDAGVEEQVVHGTGLGQQIVCPPGLAGLGADGAHLGDVHLGVEGVADACDFFRRDEVGDDGVALVLDLGDALGDVQAVDDEVLGDLFGFAHDRFARGASSPLSAFRVYLTYWPIFIRLARSAFRSEVILPSWCM